jgi:tellurite resistance protein TehA-like permease
VKIPPASWTIVMSTGVVSLDLRTVHQPVLSAILLWFAAAVWLLLVVVLAAPLAYQRGRFAREASLPVSLAGVAATAVLGIRLAAQDYRVAAAALLALAAIGWAVLLGPVLRHWATPTVGISFVVGVATDGLAVLSATLAAAYRAGWLVGAAIVLLLLALAFYVLTAARFDWRQLVTGHGDHWIAGGALAISALAAGKITQAAGSLGLFGASHQVLAVGTLVLWCLAVAWLPVLIAGEAVRPRLSYDVRRWATVFPLGMYAACSFTVGQVAGVPGLTTFGQVGTWVAFAAVLVTLAGLFRHIHKDNVMNPDSRTRAAIEGHWQASERGDNVTEHAIYAQDAILDYPQSGERFRSRAKISAQRGGHPADRHFTVLRISGGGELWVSECIITYDGVPTYSVSIMEFADEHVAHETQYFADPFGSPAWRAALAEPMPGRTITTA